MQIEYKVGDMFATVADLPGTTIIPHIVNDIKVWGTSPAAGFVYYLGNHYPAAREHYLNDPPALGSVNFVALEFDDREVIVAHMCAQRGLMNFANRTPIDYGALEKCLIELAKFSSVCHNSRIVAPAFGTKRAGGKWSEILAIIDKVFAESDIPFTVCTLTEAEQKELWT